MNNERRDTMRLAADDSMLAFSYKTPDTRIAVKIPGRVMSNKKARLRFASGIVIFKFV